MKKKKKNQEEQINYLDLIPVRNPMHHWKSDSKGIITLEVENKGTFNKIAQKLFRKPKVSYIHLDEMGSFIWPFIDGEKTVDTIAELVDVQFGEEAKPLYPRIVKYFQILESYGFVKLEKK